MNRPNASQASLRERRALLAAAVRAAQGAAALIRERARDVSTIDWRAKSHADFVSDVDTAAEEIIRGVLAEDAPGAVVIGEEFSPDARAPAGLAFIVDPLDGTTNFLHGYPWYSVSIAALMDGALAAGVVLNVPTGAVNTAIAGGGAWTNDMPIRVSTITEPARALIGTGFPFKNPEMLPRYVRHFADVTRATSGIRRAGSAALDLADVALGHFEAFWELNLMPWDFAAGLLLVREAGGIATTTEGGEIPWTESSVLAGSVAMHEWLLRVLGSE